MKALITGGKGFVGRHLANLLEVEGITVVSYDLADGQDIRDYSAVTEALKKHRPHYIFHLAAMTSVQESFEKPLECYNVNVIGSATLLEAVRNLELNPRVLLASSTEVYSPAATDAPLSESSPVNPRTPYGLSKLTMEQLAGLHAQYFGTHIVVTRTNNHTGPGQDGPFAVSSFARQIVAIERGRQEQLEHGDLSSYKSYLDVRDVVRAYRIAIDLKPYIYNITNEDNIEMKELLDRLVAQATTDIPLSLNTSLVRAYKPDKTRYLTSTELRKAGWQPEYTLERTLNDVLEYWRSK